jgi:hypothetical protein
MRQSAPQRWKVIDIGAGDSMFVARERSDYDKVKARLAPAAHMIARSEQLAAFFESEKKRAAFAARRAAPPPRYPTTQYATPADAALADSALLKTKRLGDAMDIFWDNDRLFRLGFGEAYERMSEGDRNEALWTFRNEMRSVMGHPKIADLMAQGTYRIVRSQQRPDGTVVVLLSMSSPALNGSEEMYFYKSPDGWKIYDLRLNSTPTTLEELRRGFAELKGTMTPLEFVSRMQSEANRINERARRIDQGLPPDP